MRNQPKYEETVERLKKRLIEVENQLYVLEHLRRATKKDGKPFQNISNNYPDANIIVHRDYDGLISNVNVSGQIGKPDKYGNRYYATAYIYIDYGKRRTDITFQELEQAIAEYIAKYKEEIASYTAQLAAAKKCFAKIDRLTTAIVEAIKSYPEANDGHFRSTLGYGLEEYVKHSLF